MSDRRPEKLYVHRDDRVCQLTREASNDEVLAAVRRGVESGTIKGTEMEVVPTEEPRRGPHGEPIQQEPHIVSSVIEPARCLLDPGTYLLIGPVSDGGSET